MICPECNNDSLPDSTGRITCLECETLFLSGMNRETGIPFLKDISKTFKSTIEGHINWEKEGQTVYKGDLPSDFGLDPVIRVEKPKPFCPNYYKGGIHLVSNCVKCQELLKQYKDEVHCSFCSCVVPRVLVQEGISKMKFDRDEIIHTEDDPIWIEQKLKVKTQKVMACPNCAGKIKPIKDRNGKITNQNVKTYSGG